EGMAIAASAATMIHRPMGSIAAERSAPASMARGGNGTSAAYTSSHSATGEMLRSEGSSDHGRPFTKHATKSAVTASYTTPAVTKPGERRMRARTSSANERENTRKHGTNHRRRELACACHAVKLGSKPMWASP